MLRSAYVDVFCLPYIIFAQPYYSPTQWYGVCDKLNNGTRDQAID